MCSKHFPGGKKTCMNNLPTLTPKTAKAKPVIPRQTTKARNKTAPTISRHLTKEDIAVGGSTDNNDEVDNIAMSSELEIRLKFLENGNRQLREENERLKLENASLVEKLCQNEKKPKFSFEDIKDDDKMFRFYTGMLDYLTFKLLFQSFGAAVNKLVYYDSGTNSEKLINPEHNKRGPKRSLTTEHELFLVLVRLRLGLSEEDLAYRASIAVMHMSRILIIWFDFLHNFFRAISIWATRLCIDETMPSRDSKNTSLSIVA